MIKDFQSRKQNKKLWSVLLGVEFLLAGFLILWKALFTIEIYSNHTLRITTQSVHHRLSAGGVLLLLVGVLILFVPKIRLFLQKNSALTYLIPLHMWLILVAVGVEIILRVAIYHPPFNLVRTSWFGWVAPQGSFTLYGREGYAITWFEGEIPGEIQTPFQGGDNIVVIGDSFTESFQVADNQKYVSVAETILHRDGYNFDLHNLGHSGRTMADYVSKMANYRTIYHPKAVVVQISQDDFVESFNVGKSNYFIAENSRIVGIVHTGKYKGKFEVADKLSNNFTFLLPEYLRDRLSALKGQPTSLTQVQDNEVPATPKFDVNLAQQQMDLLLEASSGTVLILVLSPNAPYISSDHIEMGDSQYENLKTFLSSYPQVILIDPLPEFQNLAISGYLPMGFFNSTQPGVGHFNHQGHEILGELLARTIEKSVK
jgi:lysophospholipase L1-like esterase